MTINISNRLVIIVGPSTSGKTTLAHKIKNEFNGNAIVISHDVVLDKINKNQPQDVIDYQFRMQLLSEINDAINNPAYSLIILDTLNIDKIALMGIFSIIRMFMGYLDEITLLKIAIPLNLLQEFIKVRPEFKTGTQDSSPDKLLLGVFTQRRHYFSNMGSLNFSYPDTQEYIIENPKETFFSFDITKTR